jgi:hypothetical protein
MHAFETPAEARAVLVSKILEQARTEAISLTEFERKLLNSTEDDDSITETELEEFDDEQGEEFWDKIALSNTLANAKSPMAADQQRTASMPASRPLPKKTGI